MFKITVTTMIASLALSAASAVPPRSKASERSRPIASKPLPVFAFLGSDTETPSTRMSLGNEPCKTEGAVVNCTANSPPTLAGVQPKWMWMKYYNQKLFSVFGTFGDGGYGPLLSAFNEKYGPPTLVTEKWQSKAGATYDNSVARWHFKGGELRLESMGLSVDEGSFSFTSDENSPPPDKPKVDF